MRKIILLYLFLCLAAVSESAGVVNRQKMMKQKAMQKKQTVVQNKQTQTMKKRSIKIKDQFQQQRIESVKEVVDFSRVWEDLKVSSRVWSEIMDDEPKVAIIEDYIQAFKSQGIILQRGPYHYLKVIDSFSTQNPKLMQSPFWDVLRFAAIVEYDYGNGQNPDLLAKQLLGLKAYEINKKRLGF